MAIDAGTRGLHASQLEALMDAAAAVLAADSLSDTLAHIAGHLRELVPHDDLALYELEASGAWLVPVFATGAWCDEVMRTRVRVGDGITGAAVRERRTRNVPRTDLDPDARTVPGTEDGPESLVSVPLIARGAVIGAANVYRTGEDVGFSADEERIVERFATMAALAFAAARQREQLRRLADTDGLTGLLNHRACQDRLQVEVARARATGAPMTVVLLDLDHFKAINDQHGHGVGDHALREVAAALAAGVRDDDAVARLGGEELVLVLPGVEGAAAVAAAERARAAVASVRIAGRALSASAGLACCPRDATDADTLLALADAALYRAKHAGRDRLVVHAA